MIMATYNYEQLGSTLKAEWQELKELAKGKTIGQLKLEKVNVYEEGGDHIFFYYKRLRGMVFGIEDNAPYIAEVMYAWNYTAEDWDELVLEKITLQPYELEQKEKTAITSAQIVVIDYTKIVWISSAQQSIRRILIAKNSLPTRDTIRMISTGLHPMNCKSTLRPYRTNIATRGVRVSPVH